MKIKIGRFTLWETKPKPIKPARTYPHCEYTVKSEWKKPFKIVIFDLDDRNKEYVVDYAWFATLKEMEQYRDLKLSELSKRKKEIEEAKRKYIEIKREPEYFHYYD